MKRRPEVLAPVGAPDCLPAAVAGGADAVYFGLRHFNARGRAGNFRTADLAGHINYLHHHGVKAYVVLNTLVHDDEYPKALDMARAAYDAGVDATIVQDFGLWHVLGKHLPGLERHASTQMTVHEPGQIRELADCGATRVILARELTMAEVAACTTAAEAIGVETEHFVHGALCYAFSGQCLISNFAGCRSANRGTCAQNCRFDYKDHETTDSVFSMRDLGLLRQVTALADAGVASLKIEGRLKGPEYVYTVSRAYRAATEAWAAGESIDFARLEQDLRGVFSRGLTTDPLDGRYDEHSRVSRYQVERDTQVDATLVRVDRAKGRCELRAKRPVLPGQGFRGAVGFTTVGFLVTAVDQGEAPDLWRCRIRIAERGPRLPAGMALVLNTDQQRKAEAAAAMQQVPVEAAVAGGPSVDAIFSAQLGAPPVLALQAGTQSATAVGDDAVAVATGRPLTQEAVAKAVGQLGGSGWQLGRLTCDIDDDVFVPAGQVKALRRQALAELGEPSAPETTLNFTLPTLGTPVPVETGLWVAVGSVAAACAALDAGAEQVWLDGLDIWAEQPPTLADLPTEGVWLRHPATVVTSPHLAAIGLPLVAGHLGAARAAREAGLPVQVDQHLNAFGVQTLAALGARAVQAAVISLECSCREVAKIVRRGAGLDLPRIGLTVHGRVPAMITRQDHGLTAGQHRQVEAVERDGGLPYEIERRPGGQTILWEGRRLAAPAEVASTTGLVDGWVLELGDLAPEAVTAVVMAYRALRDGGDPAETLTSCAAWAPSGWFPGHLHQGSRALDDARDLMEMT